MARSMIALRERGDGRSAEQAAVYQLFSAGAGRAGRAD